MTFSVRNTSNRPHEQRRQLSAHELLWHWFALMTCGLALLITLLLTLIFGVRRGVKRRPAVLINLIVVTILVVVVSSLLYYSGNEMNGRPSYPLCYTQAILRAGLGTAFLAAVLGYVLFVWRVVYRGFHRVKTSPKFETAVLLSLPWVLGTAAGLPVLIYGAVEPQRIIRLQKQWYCAIDHKPMAKVVNSSQVLIIISSVCFEIWSAVMVYLARRAATSRVTDAYDTDIAQVVGHVWRIGCYTACELVFLCFVVVRELTGSGEGMDIMINYLDALLPLLLFAIFASYKDILRCWCFWLPVRTGTEIEQHRPEHVHPRSPDIV